MAPQNLFVIPGLRSNVTDFAGNLTEAFTEPLSPTASCERLLNGWSDMLAASVGQGKAGLVGLLQGLTVIPVMAALGLEEGMPTSLADALAAEIGLQYQIPDSDGHTQWCVGSLDLNIGEARQ